MEDIRGPILFLAADCCSAWRGVEPGCDWPGEVVVPGVLGVVDVGESIGLEEAFSSETSGGAVLFDGAWEGDELGETRFAVDLAPGDYTIDAVPRFEQGAVVARYVRLRPR